MRYMDVFHGHTAPISTCYWYETHITSNVIKSAHEIYTFDRCVKYFTHSKCID